MRSKVCFHQVDGVMLGTPRLLPKELFPSIYEIDWLSGLAKDVCVLDSAMKCQEFGKHSLRVTTLNSKTT